MVQQHNAFVHSQRLLLLPPPPSETTLITYRAAYGPALTKVLTEAASQASSQTPSPVDVAVICDHLGDKGSKAPRIVTYNTSQKVLAALYRLFVSICAEGAVGQDQGDQIDVRILLVSNDTESDHGISEQAAGDAPQGPVITCQALASSGRDWTHVSAIESELGEGFLQEFIRYRKALPRQSHFKISRVPGGTSIKVAHSAKDKDHASPGQRYYSVAVGGTFDHLHVGHRLLLTATALILDPSTSANRVERSLIVGITGDELLKNKKYAEVLESWEERQAAVYQFLSSVMFFDQRQKVTEEKVFEEGPNGKAIHYTLEDGLIIKCVEIQDPFGPTITDESISALIISGETRSGGKAVNDRRTEKGWAPLKVLEVDVLDAGSEEGTEALGATGFQSKISSSEIRKRLQQRLTAVL